MDDQIGKLYVDLKGYLVTIIRNRLFTGCPDDYVYDCLNDVFEIALRKKEDPGFQDNPKGWLAVTARHVTDNFNRKMVNRLTYFQSDCEMERIPDRRDIIEELSYKLAIEGGVFSLIKSNLSEGEWNMFVMRYEKNMTAREIADEESISPACASTRLTRIKHKVETIIYQYVG